MIELKLKIDGTDQIHVEVENGIEFTGTVTLCQMSGKKFWIDGLIEEETNESD